MFIHAVHKNMVMELTQNTSGSICCCTCRGKDGSAEGATCMELDSWYCEWRMGSRNLAV